MRTMIIEDKPAPPEVDEEAVVDWAREKCQWLYWQVKQGSYVSFLCVLTAWQIGHAPPGESASASGDGEDKRNAEMETRRQVSEFLEYYALNGFSRCFRGVRKIMMNKRPLGGCALTGDDQVHAVLNSPNPELAGYADEILELSRDTHRVFQEAGFDLADRIRLLQWVKRAKNRRITNARRDRRDAAEMLYSILTRVILVSSAIEDKSTPEDKKREKLDGIRQQWKDTRARVNGRIQRHARFEYITGVCWGTLITIAVLTGLGFAAFYFGGQELNEAHYSGALAAATIGGTVGAFISVSQRVTRSTLRLDFTASRLQKVFLGTLRPAVGAVFGAFVYFAIIGGILAVQSDGATAHRNSAITLAFFAVAGFVSGFSERFAAGVLENAGSAVAPAPWGMQEDRNS